MRSKFIQEIKKLINSPLKGVNESDFLQVSFPKTGSTFTRYVFGNYLSLAFKNGVDVNFHNLGALLPEIGKDDLNSKWEFAPFPRIIKTHDAFEKKYENVKARIIYILRDPRDTMLSYHPYISKRKNANYQGTFSEFIEDPNYGIAAYNQHVEDWTERAFTVFKYEDLMTDAYALFANFFKQADFVFDEKILQEAIARSQPDKVKQKENEKGIPGFENKYKAGFTFVRNASVNQWKTEMSEADQKRIMELASPVFAELGYF